MQVTLEEIARLLGERDLRIYQLEMEVKRLIALMDPVTTEPIAH